MNKPKKCLSAIAQSCKRSKNPYHGQDRITRRVEREAGKYKMLKHFKLTCTDTRLNFERNEASIQQESALDGIYIVRAKRKGTEEMARFVSRGR